MRALAAYIVLLLLFVENPYALRGSVAPPETLRLSDTPLVLNGTGVRKFLFIPIYSASLYLPEKSSDANEIILADSPMCVRMEVLFGRVRTGYVTRKMEELLREGFELSTNGNTRLLQGRIDSYVEDIILLEIKKGDVFDITYIPERGVMTYKGGVLINTTRGLDFKRGLFGIWLSEKAHDSVLKKGMLGSNNGAGD